MITQNYLDLLVHWLNQATTLNHTCIVTVMGD
jgi:hypothetical protein